MLNNISEALIYATRTIWFNAHYRYKNNPDILELELNKWIEHLNKLFDNQIPNDINSIILEYKKELEIIKINHIPFDFKKGFLNA